MGVFGYHRVDRARPVILDVMRRGTVNLAKMKGQT
jgi:hypothetical protein